MGDMAKTSMFGGHINSAELPSSPAGTRLQFKSPKRKENADPLSCISVKGSSVYHSPSPSNKEGGEQSLNGVSVNGGGSGTPGMSFLERMAQQGVNPASINPTS